MGPAKLEEDKKLGIKIITEDEFLELIGQEQKKRQARWKEITPV